MHGRRLSHIGHLLFRHGRCCLAARAICRPIGHRLQLRSRHVPATLRVRRIGRCLRGPSLNRRRRRRCRRHGIAGSCLARHLALRASGGRRRLLRGLPRLLQPVKLHLIGIDRAFRRLGRQIPVPQHHLLDHLLVRVPRHQLLLRQLHRRKLRQPRIQRRIVNLRRVQLQVEPGIQPHRFHCRHIPRARPKGQPVQCMQHAALSLRRRHTGGRTAFHHARGQQRLVHHQYAQHTHGRSLHQFHG